MDEKEVIETTEKAPEVVLTVTVDETGKVKITGQATGPDTLKSLGVELISIGERAMIKAIL